MTPLAQALQSLPILGDDLYLRMQALNLGIVDEYLRQSERDLLSLYMREERTPTPEAVFVSAQSQLWIFGLYELLRTWRQRARELLAFASDFAAVDPPNHESWLEEHRSALQSRSASLPEFDGMEWTPFQDIVDDPPVADAIQIAIGAPLSKTVPSPPASPTKRPMTPQPALAIDRSMAISSALAPASMASSCSPASSWSACTASLAAATLTSSVAWRSPSALNATT